MAKFNFSFDQLCTVWYRSEFEIEANSQEEANEIAIASYKNNELQSLENSPVETTIEKVELKEDGLSTEEILTDDGDLVFMNGTILN